MTSSKVMKALIVLVVFFGMLSIGYLLYELGYRTEAAYVARNTLIITILCAGIVTRTAWIVYAALIIAIGLNIDLILVALLQLFITLVALKTSGSPIETTFIFFIGLLIALGIIVAAVEVLTNSTRALANEELLFYLEDLAPKRTSDFILRTALYPWC